MRLGVDAYRSPQAALSMKILQVSNSFKYAWESGGMARTAYDLSKCLVKRGHEVTVFATEKGLSKDFNVRRDQPIIIDGIETYYFSNASNYLAERAFTIPYRLPFVARKRLKDFDIIHIHDYRRLAVLVIHYYAKKHNVPYVLQAHGSLTTFFQKRWLKRIFDVAFGYRILENASKVIAGCEMEVNEYQEMGVNQDKIALIPPAYGIEEFAQLPSSGQFRHKFDIGKKHVVLFLGRLHKIKGIDFLIRSFHELIREKDDVILAIVGPDYGYGAILRNLVSRLNLSHKVLFTGYLSGVDKLSALVDADMLVQTSTYERGPGSPFEAILCGTPIIITKDTGAGEIASKIDAGYLVEYGNIQELTNAMKKILNDPAEALDKAHKAKHYITANLCWEKIVEQYESLYESVIELREGNSG